MPMMSRFLCCHLATAFAFEDTWITQTFWRDKTAIDALGKDPEYQRIVGSILALNVLGDKQQDVLYAFEGGRARIG